MAPNATAAAPMLASTIAVMAPAPARSMTSPIVPGSTMAPTLSPIMITAPTPAVSLIDWTVRL